MVAFVVENLDQIRLCPESVGVLPADRPDKITEVAPLQLIGLLMAARGAQEEAQAVDRDQGVDVAGAQRPSSDRHVVAIEALGIRPRAPLVQGLGLLLGVFIVLLGSVERRPDLFE